MSEKSERTSGIRSTRAWVCLLLLPLSGLLAMNISCVPQAGGWDPTSLEARQPDVKRFKGQRVADTPPYLLPVGPGVVLFLCRFDTDSAIPVSLPSDAAPAELGAIRLALQGWESAGLGVRFEETDAQRARIEMRFVGFEERRAAGGIGAGTGYTVSSCAVKSEQLFDAARDVALPFELTRSTVSLRRSNLSMIGQQVPLSEDELVGAALHELGHALGFPGHLAVPAGVMSKSVDTVRRHGRRLRAGEGFSSPTLAALYAVPNGTIVGRTKLAPGEAEVFADAVEIARRENWSAMHVRVGEKDALVYWEDARHRVKLLRVDSYHASLRRGEPLRFGDSALARSIRRQGTVER